MGECFSSCSSSNEIRESSSDKQANFKGPIKERSCTDSSFLVLFIFVLISLFGLVIYCTINGDIKRVLYGYDECGNICGFKNEKNSDPKFCTGREDVSGKPYLKIDASINKAADLKFVKRECVESCNREKYLRFLHRCFKKSDEKHTNLNSFMSHFYRELTQDLQYTKWKIIYLCLFAFISTLVIVFLIRFAAGIVVWFVLIGVVVVSFSATIYLWITWKRKSYNEFQNQDLEKEVNKYFAFALITTISTIIFIIMVVVMRRHIALVVQLFKESGKAIHSMPLLLVQPMVTFFFLCLVTIIWSYFAMLIQSSGLPALFTLNNNQTVYYKKDQLMKFARVYNVLVLLWVIKFIIACQHMIISGSVATWFFTRNKDNLSSPISTSVGYLFKYHLGSVALGSLIMTIICIIRAISNLIDKILKKSKNRVSRAVCEVFKYLFNFLVIYLQYLTRNAYIEIAIYGDNFCSSGHRAYKVLTTNVRSVVAINSVGNFVLFLGKVLVVAMTVLIGLIMFEDDPKVLRLWVPLTVAGIFAYLVAHCFVSVYEMVIETIFTCFCEDCNINDGIKREYYMSKELMDFVENNQKFLRANVGATNYNTI